MIGGDYLKRNVTIIKDLKGRNIVLINDIYFKGRQNIEGKEVEQYLKRYVGEFIEIAVNKRFKDNLAEKHKGDAKYGWYRYDSRFALPVYDNNEEIIRYNVFYVELVIRHAANKKLYLYDVINVKKETGKPL